jgi:hypothetical protein
MAACLPWLSEYFPKSFSARPSPYFLLPFRLAEERADLCFGESSPASGDQQRQAAHTT